MHIYFFLLVCPVYALQSKRPDFTQIFVDSVDNLNSPVYFVPPYNMVADFSLFFLGQSTNSLPSLPFRSRP